MLAVGLLGAGQIGHIHGRNVVANPRATLVAIADVDADAAKSFAEETGARVATTDAILTDDAIDAVLICTTTSTHADLVELATKTGKAVFCEKPVSLNADRTKECLQVVREAKGKLMVGFNRRFDPDFAELKRRIEAGEAGKVELVTILSRDPRPPPVSYIKGSGGLFRDMMIHDFDMARFLLGEDPVEVSATASCLVDPEIGKAGDVDTAAVLLRTKNGKIAQISNSRRATYGYDQRVEVHGSQGLIAVGNRRATTVEQASASGYLREPVLHFFLERYAEAYRAELEAFVAGVLDGAPLSPTGDDGLVAQRLADAATEAATTGQSVRVS